MIVLTTFNIIIILMIHKNYSIRDTTAHQVLGPIFLYKIIFRNSAITIIAPLILYYY